MLVAGQLELVEPGVFGLRPVFAVVDLAVRAVAALDDADRVLPQQRHHLRGGRSASEVGDVQDVDAFGDDQLQDRLAQQLPGGRDGDRADAGDLAILAVGGPAAL